MAKVFYTIKNMTEGDMLISGLVDLQAACKVYDINDAYVIEAESDNIRLGKDKKLACGVTADVALEVKMPDDAYVEYDNLGAATSPAFLTIVDSGIEILGLAGVQVKRENLENHVVALRQAGFSDADVRATIDFVNTYLYTRGLPEAMIAEITAKRDLLPPDYIYNEKGKFQHDRYCEWFIKAYHAKIISGKIHVYQNPVYAPVNIERLVIKHAPSVKEKDRHEVISYLMNAAPEYDEIPDARFVPFKNGVYDLEAGELIEHSQDLILTNLIPHNYNKDAKCPEVDKFLSSLVCEDENALELLKEVMGYILYRDKSIFQRMVFLLGSGSNGKTTFGEFLERMVGSENTSHIDLTGLTSKSYSAPMLQGKLLNLSLDTDTSYIPESGLIKQLSDGSSVTTRVIREAPVTWRSVATLVCAGNAMPRIGNGKDTLAVLRRLIILPMYAHFSPSNPGFDAHILEKITTEAAMEYGLKLAIEGLEKLLKDGDFVQVRSVTEEKEDYSEQLNPMNDFYENYESDNRPLEGSKPKEVWAYYLRYCEDNKIGDRSRLRHNEFFARIKLDKGLSSRNSRKYNERHICEKVLVPLKDWVRSDDAMIPFD